MKRAIGDLLKYHQTGRMVKLPMRNRPACLLVPIILFKLLKLILALWPLVLHSIPCLRPCFPHPPLPQVYNLFSHEKN